MKTLSLTAYILIVLFFSRDLYSQVAQEWLTRFSESSVSEDLAYSITVDAAGNVYVTGNSSSGAGSYDYLTIKYNSAGVQQWTARYSGPGNNIDLAYKIAVDGSGNVYVTGWSYGNGTLYDYATIKYNSAGIQQWVQRYNSPGSGDDYARSLAVDGLGNVYVTGWCQAGGIYTDYLTIKYNSSGDSVWVKNYNGPAGAWDAAYSITVDGSGNAYVIGESYGIGTYNDCVTVKYDSSGGQQWASRYNGQANSNDAGYSIAVDGAGNVYAAGSSSGSGTYNDYATIKYNSFGDSVWVRKYNGPANQEDLAYSLAVDGMGNVYVTGESGGAGVGADYATIKYNSAGVQQWLQRYNGPGNGSDIARLLVVDGSGNVYVTGESGGAVGGADYATVKYNSAGTQQWLERYNGPVSSTDVSASLAVDLNGNVYVSGWSWGNASNYDFATIKYSQVVAIQPISNEIPDRFSLSQNYPNPFNPMTKIKFNVAKASNVNITVFDVLGRHITTLVNEKLNAGTYETDWNASNMPGGVYFYRIETEDFSETKKMILVK